MSADITQWLGQLGLERYAEVFSQNDVDLRSVVYLTDSELRDLGVSLGHRKIILKAIAERLGERWPTQTTPAAVSTPERRQLTVMFCDLVDSTGLAQRHDVEVVKQIMDRFRECGDRSAKRFGGNIGGFRGDGLLICFGYPEANEYDPERAIRAGLEIAGAIREIDTQPRLPLACRVGIATGECVVGESVGSDLATELDVTGLAANLAARLQQMAKPNTVLISDATRRLAGNLFRYSELEPVSIKGLSGAHPVWRVEGESASESRFDATHPPGELTPMVGREQDLTKLLRHWSIVQTGTGQAMLLLGEAGIGKSRLARAFCDQVKQTEHTLIRCFCVEHHKSSALFPIMAYLERAAGFEQADSSGEKLNKLERFLGSTMGADDARGTVPLYAALLSIPTDGRYPPLSLSAELQKERILGALEQNLRAVAKTRPALVLLEDVHWADPTTEEFVGRVLSWMPHEAVFFLMTQRVGEGSDFTKGDRVSTLRLDRLTREYCESVISYVSHQTPISQQTVFEIVAKSDGIPLYLEEITKAIVESELLGSTGDGRASLGMSVPNSVQDYFAARLDRLPRAKRVAQIGATIGRQFPYELLRAVSELPEEQLNEALEQLTAAELLTRDGRPPSAQYSFKHALMQEWAYENQLKAARPKLHRSIARSLEERFSGSLNAQPELLAHHYARAGEYQEAISYWREAAKRSAHRAAYAEALKYLSNALECLERLDSGPQKDRTELELRVAQGLSMERTLGYGAAEVKQTYERARRLCHELGETVDMVPVLLGLYIFHLVRADQNSDLATAQDLADQCVRLSNESGRIEYLIDSYAALGYVRCYLGDLRDAREVLERCVGLYEFKWGELEFGITAQDPGVASLALLGVVSWLLGFPDASLKALDRAFVLADRLGQPINHAVICAHAAQLHQLRREPDRAAEYALKGMRISSENGYFSWEAACAMHLGIARATAGDPAGIALAQEHLQRWRIGGAELNRPYFLAGIAAAELVAGKADAGLSHIAEALEHAARSGEDYFVPLLHQIRGDYYATLPGQRAAAEKDLRCAIAKALEQDARMFRLRALCSLRRLCGSAGGSDEVEALRALVAELAGIDETVDLREARALCV